MRPLPLLAFGLALCFALAADLASASLTAAALPGESAMPPLFSIAVQFIALRSQMTGAQPKPG